MALYEITQDCRIANKEYQKWDIVSDTEVGWYYTSVMKPTNSAPKQTKKPEKVETPVEDKEEVEEKTEEVEKPKVKRQSKRK